MSADPTFTTFLVGAVAGMGTFIAYIVRSFIADLQKSRDRGLSMAEGSTVALDRMSAEISKLRDEIRKMHVEARR